MAREKDPVLAYEVLRGCRFDGEHCSVGDVIHQKRSVGKQFVHGNNPKLRELSEADAAAFEKANRRARNGRGRDPARVGDGDGDDKPKA